MKMRMILVLMFMSFYSLAEETSLLRGDFCELMPLNCTQDTVEVVDQNSRCGCLYLEEMIPHISCPATANKCDFPTKWSWLKLKHNQESIGCGCYETYVPDEKI